ncbi:MAG: PAS domain S-box protein, partial [Myxococcales bacterium]|nr:PAS domain S-box protein [Myxococcales bacterium]
MARFPLPPQDELLRTISDLRTELTETSASAAEWEIRFYALLNASPFAVILVSARGLVTMLNTAAENLFGYSAAELIGQAIEVLVPQSARHRHVDFRQKYSDDPIPRKMVGGRDLTGRRKDGKEVAIEVGLNPINFGNEVMTLCAVVDVTWRRDANETLRLRTQELARSNEALERFAYAASHDLKAPLRAIRNLAGWLEEDLAEHLNPETSRQMELLRLRAQ